MKLENYIIEFREKESIDLVIIAIVVNSCQYLVERHHDAKHTFFSSWFKQFLWNLKLMQVRSNDPESNEFEDSYPNINFDSPRINFFFCPEFSLVAYFFANWTYRSIADSG